MQEFDPEFDHYGQEVVHKYRPADPVGVECFRLWWFKHGGCGHGERGTDTHQPVLYQHPQLLHPLLLRLQTRCLHNMEGITIMSYSNAFRCWRLKGNFQKTGNFSLFRWVFSLDYVPYPSANMLILTEVHHPF